MATWPASLPQSPLLTGYVRTLQNTIIQTQTDAGVPKARQRFTATVEPIIWPTYFDDTQKDTFETFYNTTISGGALSFDITLPDVSGTSSCRIVQPPSFRKVSDKTWFTEIEMIKLP